MKFELNLSNYAKKADLKKYNNCYISDFAKITHLSNLESDVDKLDVDKLKNVASTLSNLKIQLDKSDVNKLVAVPVDVSDIVKNDVVTTDVYNDKVKKYWRWNTWCY